MNSRRRNQLTAVVAALSLFGAAGVASAADEKLKGKILEYFRWKHKLQDDINAEIGDLTSAELPGFRKGNIKLSHGGQTQEIPLLVSDDGKHAIFQAIEGSLTDSKIKGVKETTVQFGRPVQVLVAADAGKIVVGSVEDITIDVAAERKKEAEAAAKQAQENLKKITTEGQPSKGPKNAKVTIVEFSDFQCPFCARARDTLANEVLKEYGGKVRVVYKNFPLNFHPWAEPAAIAGECLVDQDPKLFWKVYDYYFANQKEVTVENLKEKTLAAIEGEKFDRAKFEDCYDNKRTLERVQQDMSEGQSVGVTGTPAFLINGRVLSGAVPFQQFKAIIDEELKKGGKS